MFRRLARRIGNVLGDRWTGVPIELVHAADVAPLVDTRAELLRSRGPARVELGSHRQHLLADSLRRDLSHPPDAACLAHADYWSEPPRFARLFEVRVDPHWGFVQVEPGKFLDESVHAARWFGPRLSAILGDPKSRIVFGIGGGRYRYVAHRAGVDVARAAAPPRRLSGTYLLLGHAASQNYGHFCMDCLPGAFEFVEELRAGEFKLLTKPLKPWQLRLLDRLGIPRTAVHEIDDDLITVESLIFPLALTCCYTPNPGPMHRAMFDALRGEPDASAPARIYISRAGRVESRAMVNEGELLEALGARGFQTIDPGSLSIDEQIKTFSRAEIIVGALGAGMTNIGFAPQGCAVVEIIPTSVAETWVAHLAHVLGHHFAYVVAPVCEATERTLAGRVRTDLTFTYETPLQATLDAIDGLRSPAASEIATDGNVV